MKYTKKISIGLFSEYKGTLYYKKKNSTEIYKSIKETGELKIGDFDNINFTNVFNFFILKQTFLLNVITEKEEDYFSSIVKLKEGEKFSISEIFGSIVIANKYTYPDNSLNNTLFIDFVKKEILYEFPWRGNIKGLLNDNAILFSPNIEVSETFISFDLQTLTEVWSFQFIKFKDLCSNRDDFDWRADPQIVEFNEEYLLINTWYGVGSLSTTTGELLWFKENILLEKTRGKYIALTECFYREYNPDNGEIIRELNVETEFIEKSFSPSMYDFKMIDDVYLVGVQRMYRSKVILLNTETGKIDWKYEFKDADGDFIRLKGDPLRIFGNRIYVHDLENTLHIFEKK